MVLETPIEDSDGKEDKQVWAREVKLLEGLVGMDREGDEFRGLETELAKKGEEQRQKAMEAFEKKTAKEKVKGKGKQRKRKGGQDEDDEGSRSDA